MPPAAPSFPSCRKRRGRKGALGYVWCILRVLFRQAPIFCRYNHTYSPYGRFGTRRLLRYGQICESLPLNGCGKSALRPKFYSVVRIRRNPYKSFSNSVRNSELLQISRERSKKTEAVFLVALRGSGGKSKSPRARFLFVTFSFGEAKEKVRPHPRICRRLSALCRLTTHPAGQDTYSRSRRCGLFCPAGYRPAAGRRSAWCAPCPRA